MERRKAFALGGREPKMNPKRALYLKTLRYFCYLALAAILGYFVGNWLGFYPDRRVENYASSSKSGRRLIQKNQPETPTLESHKETSDRNRSSATGDGKDQILDMNPQRIGDVQQNAPQQQESALPTEEPNWEERSSLGYAQAMLKVRLKPFIQDGNQEGFEVKSIRGDSPLKAIGVKDGDIIESINGEPIDSDLDLLRIRDAIINNYSYTISVIRDGEPITLANRVK